jgi:hypothetical protein
MLMQEEMFELVEENPLQVNMKNILDMNNKTKKMWMGR